MPRCGIISTLVFWIVSAILIATVSVNASSIELVVDDQSFANRLIPILTDNGFVVPLQLAEELGAEVIVDGNYSVLKYAGKEVRIGPSFPVNFVEIGDEKFVPLNILADLMRLRVNWDRTARVLTLSRWTLLGGSLPPLPQTNYPIVLSLPEPISFSSSLEPVSDAPSPPRAAIVGILHPLDEPDERPTKVPFSWPALTQQTGLVIERETLAGVEHYHFHGPGEITIKAALIVDPFRLVVDVYGVDSGELEPLTVDSATVRQIRVSTENNHLRLVFDLNWAVGHRIEQVHDNHSILTLNRPLTMMDVNAEPHNGRITLGVPAATPYQFYELTDPSRIVIDLEETTLVNGPENLEVKHGPIKRIRSAQFAPDTTRIVLDLREPVLLRTRSFDGELAMEYGDSFSGQLAYRVINDQEVHFAFGAGVESEVTVFFLSHPDRIAIDVHGVTLDEPLQEALIDQGPAYRLRASQFDNDTVRIVADLRRFVHPQLYREGDKIVVALKQPQLTGRRITIDAGHGGRDPGAISSTFGLVESEVNLTVALRLEQLIVEAGGTVQLTRRDDTYVDLWARSDMANEFKSDVMVSIHHNASRAGNATTAKGTETYAQANDAESVRLGAEIQRSLVSALGTQDRGLRANPGYIVLNRARMPAILTEIAFMTHVDDERLLANEWFLHRAAEGIFNGLLKFFHPTPNSVPMHNSRSGASPDGGSLPQWVALI